MKNKNELNYSIDEADLIYSINALVLIAALMFSSMASAVGGIGDGGGQAVVCRDANNQIVTAELLDLFEAKNYFVLPVDYSRENEGYLQIAKAMAGILDKTIPSTDPTSRRTTTVGGGSIAVDNKEVSTDYALNGWLLYRQYKKPSTSLFDHAEYLNSKKLMLPGDLALPPVGDSTPRVIPTGPGCRIEQVAIYSDGTSQVRFVEKIWNAFSETDKAALLIHEVLYSHLRDFGDTNSDRTRLIVANLFGNFPFVSVVQDVPTTHLSCWAKSDSSVDPEFQFVVYPQDPKEQTHTWASLNFVRWNGEIVMSETKIQVPMDYFAKYFKIDAVLTADNASVTQNLENSLLKNQKYTYKRQTDQNTKEFKLFFRAGPQQNGTGDLQIKCRKKLYKIEFIDNGFSEIEVL